MWDSHVRVGGAKGSNLDFAVCPKKSQKESCYSTSMLFHVTNKASGYFENVWTWIADHDNDYVLYREPDSSKSQVSIYGARGMLIESQEPSWFYGTGSEHAVLYQYQLHKAKNVRTSRPNLDCALANTTIDLHGPSTDGAAILPTCASGPSAI
jgi:hypothetical protein